MNKGLIAGIGLVVLGIGGFLAYKVMGKKKPAPSANPSVGSQSKSTAKTAETLTSEESTADSGKLKGKDKRAMVKQAGAGLKGKAKRQAKRSARKANNAKGFDGIDEDSSMQFEM